MADQNAIILYVFSGPHLGAEIPLKEGSYVLGTDDSCDIILRGSALAARHALLLVQNDGCRIRSLDGQILIDNNPVQEESALVAGQPWYLGLTCFAWNLPGVTQEMLIPNLAGSVAVSEAANAVKDAEGRNLSDAEGKGGNLFAADSNGEEKADESLQMAEEKKPHKSRSFFRIFLFLFLLGLLIYLSSVLSPKPTLSSQYPQITNETLKKAGFEGLEIAASGAGVSVRGVLDSDAQRTEIRNLARGLHFPVYLDVAVREDVLKAAQTAFQARGFYTSVNLVGSAKAGSEDALASAERKSEDTAIKSSEQENGLTLHVSGYMKDMLIEQSAFVTLARDVQILPHIERHIVYEQQLAAELEPALVSAGLDFLHLSYGPGQVEVMGQIPAGVWSMTEAVREKVEKKLGIPIHIVMGGVQPVSNGQTSSGSAAQPGAEKPQNSSMSVAPSASFSDLPDSGSQFGRKPGDVLGGLKITGVTLKPLRFVTTSDGQRLFEGSELSSGYILDSIGTSELILRRGNEKITHTLRGVQ